jgi:hypothetical protein
MTRPSPNAPEHAPQQAPQHDSATRTATASAATKLRPHGDLQELAPGVWMVTGALPFPLKRNMTVVQLGDGSLLLHSVIAMDEARMAQLASLGAPSVIVVPSGGHRMDAPFYKRRFPAARVLAPAAARARVEAVLPVDATCEEALPPLSVRAHPLAGLRTGEMAYEAPLSDGTGGRVLMFCDAVANSDYQPGPGGWFLSKVTGGVKGRLGVPRIVKLSLIRDRAAARASLMTLAELPNLALLTVAHGKPIRDQVAEALREAAAYLA